MVAGAGCSFKIFEDVGSDPHPPTVAITALSVFTEPSAPASEPPPVGPDVNTSFLRGRSIPWDSGGFTLASGQLFQIRVTYTDAGGDIVKIQLRDRDGALQADFLPVSQSYFPGTSGTVLCPVTEIDAPPVGIEITGILGRHRLELWAEDSHLSRSEKVEFVITLVP